MTPNPIVLVFAYNRLPKTIQEQLTTKNRHLLEISKSQKANISNYGLRTFDFDIFENWEFHVW